MPDGLQPREFVKYCNVCETAIPVWAFHICTEKYTKRMQSLLHLLYILNVACAHGNGDKDGCEEASNLSISFGISLRILGVQEDEMTIAYEIFDALTKDNTGGS